MNGNTIKALVGVGILFLCVTSRPALALCLFGMGSTCAAGSDIATHILLAQINSMRTGRFEFKNVFLFDTLQLGQSEQSPGDNIRKLTRARSMRDYINEKGDCSHIENIWPKEMTFSGEKQEFCETTKLMKARELASLEVSLEPIKREGGGGTQQIYMKLAMTEGGQAQLDRFLLGASNDSFIVATEALYFVRVLGGDNGWPITQVKFEYDDTPNVWAHVGKHLPKNTLKTERKTGVAKLEHSGDSWKLAEPPRL